jgi:hypothetical protein|tara:strand:- start:587 stop:970 length:384 start_codon:yes stop_codon:yes gene_type:complete
MLLARIISILPAIFLIPVGIGWVLNPAETSVDFGFVFNELSKLAQNTLIRDLTGFFLGISALCIIGAITMKYIWLAAPAMIFLFVLVGHAIAAVFYGTGFADVFLPEVLLFILCSLAAYLIYRQEKN